MIFFYLFLREGEKDMVVWRLRIIMVNFLNKCCMMYEESLLLSSWGLCYVFFYMGY